MSAAIVPFVRQPVFDPRADIDPKTFAALKSAMQALAAEHSRAQRCLSGNYITTVAAEDLNRLLLEVVRQASNARSLLP